MKKIILLSVTTLFIISCNNNNTENKTPNQDTVAAATTTHQEANDTTNAEETIELDNGQKWKINAEMKPHILAMQNITEAYIKDNSKDYKFLAKQLKEKDDALIKSCTMDGKSHDELHKWLHPHLERVEALEKAENEQKANEIVSQIKKSFDIFHQYFQ